MTGMAKKSNTILIMILLMVGLFTGLMGKSGIAYGFVWMGEKIGLTGGSFVAFSFLAACIIATSTGTSIVSTRFCYSFVAGIITFTLFWLLGGNGHINAEAETILVENANPKGLIMLVPIAVLLLVAILEASGLIEDVIN